MLASVCGYVATTGIFRLNRDQFALVIDYLTPAEAATHMPHPNLWSWRQLLSEASISDSFVAFFVASMEDPPVDRYDKQFRRLLSV